MAGRFTELNGGACVHVCTPSRILGTAGRIALKIGVMLLVRGPPATHFTQDEGYLLFSAFPAPAGGVFSYKRFIITILHQYDNR